AAVEVTAVDGPEGMGHQRSVRNVRSTRRFGFSLSGDHIPLTPRTIGRPGGAGGQVAGAKPAARTGAVSWIWRILVILPSATVKCSATRSLPRRATSKSYSNIASFSLASSASMVTLWTSAPNPARAWAKDSAVG